MQKNIFVVIFIGVIFLIGCKKETTTVDLKSDYYPMNVGSWIIYDVDSIVYDDFLQINYRHHFQLKEMITSSFTDGEGDLAYRLERYERDSATQTFNLKNVWQEKIKNNQAQKVEENQRFVKFIFPPQSNETWKGNAYIKPVLTDPNTKFLGDWDYHFYAVDDNSTIGAKTFANCAVVIQQDETIPALQQTLFKEIYERGVGLIYYHHKFVEKQPTNVNWVSGFDVTATINSYGN